MKIVVHFDYTICIDAMKRIFVNEKICRKNFVIQSIDFIELIFQFDDYTIIIKKKLIIFSFDEIET